MELEKIPQGVWSVLVGFIAFGGALLGTFMANSASEKRLLLQFKNDEERRRQDHEHELRREVYMGAVETLGFALQHLARYGDLSVTIESLGAEWAKAEPKLMNVLVVGQQETVAAFVACKVELGLTAAKVVVARAETQARRDDANRLLATIETQRKLADGTSAQGGSPAELGVVSQRLQALSQQHTQLLAAYRKAHKSLAELVGNESIRLGQFIAPAILCARREVGLSIDEDAFRAALGGDGRQRSMEALAKVFADADRLFPISPGNDVDAKQTVEAGNRK